MRTALQRCGFNAETATHITEQGFETPASLQQISDGDLSDMVKNSVRATVAVANITFPFLAVKRLHAFRFWAGYRQRTAQTLTAGDFADAEMALAMTRLRQYEEKVAASKDSSPTRPDSMKYLTGWKTFEEKFLNYLSQLRGQALIPLSYVIREVQTVTPAIREATYDDFEEELVATTTLAGGYYQDDNKKVWSELKGLLIDGDGWTYIKQFDRPKDGRAAFFALKRQCEGESARLSITNRAYSKIAKATYSGPRGKSYNFARYVQIHQEAYNDIVAAAPEERIPESKRVRDFLKGIKDPNLKSGVAHVLGNTELLNNFERAQQYLSTVVTNEGELTSAREAESRQVAGIEIEDRWYAAEEWQQLGDEGRQAVIALKKEKEGGGEDKKKKKPGKKKNVSASQHKRVRREVKALKRQIAQLKKGQTGDDGEEDEPDDDTPSNNAGDQFGRTAHNQSKKKKQKK